MFALVTDSASPAGIRLEDVPPPSALASQVIVEVRAIALNRGEIGMISGSGKRLGWDFAGVVSSPAEDGSGPRVGERVFGYVSAGVSAEPGTWAQRVAVHTRHLARIPDGVSFSVATTLPIAGLTALQTLRLGGSVLGRRVLVGGASGAVGRFAVALAAKAGAEVTALVRRPHVEGLEELGARRVAVGLEQADGQYDLILDSTGAAALAHALEHVAPGGTLVSFGNSSGGMTTFDTTRFFLASGARLHAYVVFIEAEATAARDLAYLASLVREGTLRPLVSLETSIRDAAAAITAMNRRSVEGRVVLIVD
jgi:NADPH:quinone reductase-like Zn-dependent oxidoreductase